MNIQLDTTESTVVSSSQRIKQLLKIDWLLFLALVLVAVISLAVLYSASGSDLSIVFKQTMRIGLAFLALLICAQIPPGLYRYWAPWVYAFGLILLLLVLLVGDTNLGARRWLDLGFFQFQPSEIMKLALPMMVAWYLSPRVLPPNWRMLSIATVMIAVPAVLIYKQPDLGTTMLIFAAGGIVIFLAGLSWRTIALFALLVIIVAPLMWFFFMHDYQRERLLTFLNPERDSLGAGYHIIQSKIAIGSGGPFGKGWLHSTQAKLNFLPEQTTDFIFSVIAEEFGFVGAAGLIVLYTFIIFRGCYIAAQARDTFSRLLAGSITFTFFIYVFTNTGMVSGLLPVVGIPLPLVSYGGTSMVTLLAGFGILMSIHSHHKLMPK